MTKTLKIQNDDPDLETSCGFSSWRPSWLQSFSNPPLFTFLFCILGILQGALFTYFIGIMSTLERRFSIDSKTTGFIFIADNLSNMIASPVVGYLSKKYNQSQLIASGLLIVGLSSLMAALPYTIYGPGTSSSLLESTNSTTNRYELCATTKIEEICPKSGPNSVVIAVAILWISNCLNGLGQTAYYTVGVPFIDDSVGKKNSPVYISILATNRLLGPTLGFFLSSFSLSYYEDPFVDNPGMTNRDPHWIGAWWLGFLILGLLIIIFTIPLFFFPKRFKGVKMVSASDNLKEEEKKKKSSDGVWPSLKRLATNKLLLVIILSGLFRVIGYLGYYLNKPKFMEINFGQTASSASFFTGATSTFVMVFGLLGSGLALRFFKPRARYIALYIVAVELISCLGLYSTMFLSCPRAQVSRWAPPPYGPEPCNPGCSCSKQVYQPVCGVDWETGRQTSYYSPCEAGCRYWDKAESRFTDCSCISSTGKNPSMASIGMCKAECEQFIPYLVIVGTTSVLTSTARIGDSMILLRAVEQRDKAFAMGIFGFVMALFAYIPYPLIFGTIIDWTCKIWEHTCGRTGNCLLYNVHKFRTYFHLTSLAFLLTGTLIGILTAYYARQITHFYDDPEIVVAVVEEEVESKDENQNNIEMNTITES